MRIGVPLEEPSGPDPMSGLREQVQRAADDGFASVWLSNIFGLDALTALAVVGNQVGGIELGSAVVPTYPRHPAALAQQALTSAAACGGGRLVLGIGVSPQVGVREMYRFELGAPGRFVQPGTRTPCVGGPRGSSRYMGSCRPTGPCSTAKAPPGPETWRSSVTRTPSAPRSAPWPRPASPTSWPAGTEAPRRPPARIHSCAPSWAEPPLS